MKPRWLLAVIVLSAALFLAAPAYAAGDDPVSSPLGLFFRWVNSAIVFGFLIWLIIKKGPAFFRGRREVIVAAITEAGRVKADADRRLREVETKLAGLDEEIARLREAARREGAADAERLRAATESEIAKIERAAETEIATAERAARMELKAAAARLAVERAEALIRTQLSPAMQAGLFQSFVNDLARSAN
jgi:F-type H+-transporting ATPase subunit b